MKWIFVTCDGFEYHLYFFNKKVTRRRVRGDNDDNNDESRSREGVGGLFINHWWLKGS